ncbi:hypothetical protein QBC38DRAFT_487429 [Podospora fimiseda]|uniref:Uncharacterized protein n=1 Tax=Podospora fimiseda TaxID=252190 RepID=A0AAN7BHV0_9PEZI|nr:hypothetical protein QBC38DRAFT_487429 [Podospora fimiseda]
MSATILTGQAPINLGPLTTIFTPPPACATAVAIPGNGLLGDVFGGQPRLNSAYQWQACSRGNPVDAASCWPETTKGVAPKEAPFSGRGFYSPGINCPIGYATACAATGGTSGKSDWPVQFRLVAGETAVGCCPSGYACANINGQTCTRVATSTAVPAIATCDGANFKTISVPSVPTITLMAPMIQINFQSTDLPSSTIDPLAMATGTRTITIDDSNPAEETLQIDPSSNDKNSPSYILDPQQTIPTHPSDSTSSSSQSQNQGGGLPSNVKVGLAVTGAVVVVLAFVFALFYFWRKKKNKLEDREMDQFYARQGNGMGIGRSGQTEPIPGWYRGERLMTPTTSSGFMDGFRDSPPAGPREMMMPADESFQRPMTPRKDGVGYYRGLRV